MEPEDNFDLHSAMHDYYERTDQELRELMHKAFNLSELISGANPVSSDSTPIGIWPSKSYKDMFTTTKYFSGTDNISHGSGAAGRTATYMHTVQTPDEEIENLNLGIQSISESIKNLVDKKNELIERKTELQKEKGFDPGSIETETVTHHYIGAEGTRLYQMENAIHKARISMSAVLMSPEFQMVCMVNPSDYTQIRREVENHAWGTTSAPAGISSEGFTYAGVEVIPGYYIRTGEFKILVEPTSIL